jgi:hypothetical protein
MIFPIHSTVKTRATAGWGATLYFLFSLKANKGMFEQNLNVSFLKN